MDFIDVYLRQRRSDFSSVVEAYSVVDERRQGPKRRSVAQDVQLLTDGEDHR